MSKLLRMAFIGLLSNILLLFVNVQPLVSGDCSDGFYRETVQLYRLAHGQPVTVAYEPGQSATLAGDAGGSAKLIGHSVVGVRFEPTGKGLGYGTEPQSLAAQPVESLLAPGHNIVKLVAVNPADQAWLTVKTPCPPAPLATRVLIPTPTPAAIAEDAILSHSVTISHTDETVSSDHADTAGTGAKLASDTLAERMGRILIAAAFLGLLLAFTLGNPRRWAWWVKEHVEQFDAEAAKRSLRERWEGLRRRVQDRFK